MQWIQRYVRSYATTKIVYDKLKNPKECISGCVDVDSTRYIDIKKSITSFVFIICKNPVYIKANSYAMITFINNKS